MERETASFRTLLDLKGRSDIIISLPLGKIVGIVPARFGWLSVVLILVVRAWQIFLLRHRIRIDLSAASTIAPIDHRCILHPFTDGFPCMRYRC